MELSESGELKIKKVKPEGKRDKLRRVSEEEIIRQSNITSSNLSMARKRSRDK